MKVLESDLPGVLLLKPIVYKDSRGFFVETWNDKRFREVTGQVLGFMQDNHSRSHRNVLRGLHFQLKSPQGKLVFVTRGRVFDVAVDIRLDSPTFGRWAGFELSDQNHYQLWLPPGFAHGFCAISREVDLVYKCSQYYDPADDKGIVWNDPTINVSWPVSGPILSERDENLPSLDQAKSLGILPKLIK